MRIDLPYGDGVFTVDLPGRDGLRTAAGRSPAPVGDTAGALRRAVTDPVAGEALPSLVPGKGRISVLVADITRGAWVREVLRALLGVLEDAGAGPDRVDIVIAAGTHRMSDAGGLSRHLGPDVTGRWRTIEHDADDDEAMAEVGETAAGTVCRFRRSVAESALVVAIGGVTYHYFAGYGGARKLVLPGVAAGSTIVANHRLSLKKDPGEGIADGCRPGKLDGNPVHADMIEGARLLPASVFAVNVVTDETGRVAFLNAGELDLSHRAACRFLDEHFMIQLDRPCGAVIAAAGGWPRDINLLQAHKAMRNAASALDEGGVMLIAAACPEGIGSSSYREAFDDGRMVVPDRVRRRYTLNSQTALSTREITTRFSVYLHAGLDASEVSRFGMCPWEEGFAGFLLDGIPDEDILVLPNAAMFLPVVAGDGSSKRDEE
ncbi:MAG: nickel-dependent lactate racemase [Candidatus Krumholzibacteriota bacterium]|nr:nickel-dependent lactate racemase [Candidatus Krumholzibacteriota bacterium]